MAGVEDAVTGDIYVHYRDARISLQKMLHINSSEFREYVQDLTEAGYLGRTERLNNQHSMLIITSKTRKMLELKGEVRG